MSNQDGKFEKGMIPWNKGKKASQETRINQSRAALGRKHSEETKRKMSETRSVSIQRLSVNFKKWREKVFEKDQYKCQECGISDRKKLHPHHIVPFEKSIELRFEVSNGKTLCNSCHGKLEGFQNGHKPWSAGKKFSPEHRAKLSAAKMGKKPTRPFQKGNVPWNKGMKMKNTTVV